MREPERRPATAEEQDRDDAGRGAPLASRRAIVVAGGAVVDPTAAAEATLRSTLDEVTRLDAEIEELSDALADFSRRWERAVGEAFADLGLAERLVRTLQALEGGLAELAEKLRSGAPPPPRRRAATSRRARARAASREAQGEDPGAAPRAAERPAAEETPPEVLPAEVALKRIYRRLARLLHPDLAQDGERVRLGDLMARVNAAYAKGDLTALEVMAEKVGAGEPPGELGAEERRAHLERRTATLARIAASLGRERARLVRSDTHRLRDEALRAEAAGEDFLARSRAEIAEEAEAAYADARARLARLTKVARDVARARSTAMKQLEKRGPTGARRAFDPLQEADLVRLGADRLARSRATAEARELARTLEAQADAAPAEVALTLLAFFAEDAGGRPPDALLSPDGWSLRWDRLRAAWPAAPDLPRALARLPRWLAVGARAQGSDVVAGAQLGDATLAAGVRIALERASVARIGRDVLAALGPDLECEECGVARAGLHLHRTRGLDELHGVACPECGAILRSYWRYGEADGLEALAPHALRLGLVAEATAQLAGTAIGFQMLPAERERLTATALRRRFTDLYLAPYEVDLPPSAIGLAAGEGELAPGARVAPSDRLRFTVADGAGLGAEELLELLRARIERRFRP
ncbi:MAG TPA: J domain-containing protein [Anaeromyxobacter sp.]